MFGMWQIVYIALQVIIRLLLYIPNNACLLCTSGTVKWVETFGAYDTVSIFHFVMLSIHGVQWL